MPGMNSDAGISGYRVESCVIQAAGELEQDWLSLQQRADCSFFQSWGWIGPWLEQIAMDLSPLVVRVWFEDALVGLGIFVGKRISRHLFVRSEARFLHEYPFDDQNMTIEYNGLLADREHQQAVYSETINHLFRAGKACDELHFGAVGESTDRLLRNIPAMREETSGYYRVLEESQAFSVSLDQFGPGIDAYLDTLGANRRTQIRRTLRLFGEKSTLQLQTAADTDEALHYFDGLRELHTARWQAEGQLGSFANKRWEAFHRALISARFRYNEVQLLRVGNSEGVIGYLYNFTWRGRVYVLQTGFRKFSDKRLMPGYAVHALAIVYNKQQGMEVYDLMHGDSLYKRLLCNRTEPLRWVVIQKRRWMFELEERVMQLARGTKRKLKLLADH